MSYNWGPYFIVPSEVLKTYSGKVLLREHFDEQLLSQELKDLGLAGYPKAAINPWYYRRKNSETWIKIGESRDEKKNFSVPWDTEKLENGEYEVLGMMHVAIKKEDGEEILARQNIVSVTVNN
ncbi:MAG: hypothetical protein AB1585_11700 [Thermodesulfobacteriota bacterium]